MCLPARQYMHQCLPAFDGYAIQYDLNFVFIKDDNYITCIAMFVFCKKKQSKVAIAR